MEVILSSEMFNPNETLWAQTSPLQGKDFLVEVGGSDEKNFESKPLSARLSEMVTESESEPQDEALSETHVEAEEIFLDEPVEKTVTLTEAEFEETLAKVRRDTETDITEQLGISSKDELGRLGKQQEEFFRSLLDNLNHGDALVSEFVSLALKLGTLLARTQLTLDEEVIKSFVKSAVKEGDTTAADIFSVKLSGSWATYRESINTQLPEKINLVFDDSLNPGDVILTAGQGGYFDLLGERINDIQRQLDSIDYRSSEQTAIGFFQESADKHSDSRVEEIPRSNDEVSRSASEQVGSVGAEESQDSAADQGILNEDASSDGTKTENPSDEQGLESSIEGGQENGED
jgi:hypothetical protein